MKIVLSNKIFFKPDEGLVELLQKQLTYEIVDQSVKIPRYHSMFGKVSKDVYWMPNTRIDMLAPHTDNLEVIDKRVRVDVVIPPHKFVPRDDQQKIIDEYETDAIINGAPGFGKTITALGIAYKLQQKTLVICTNVDIRKMWEKEIEKWFGFSPGIIGSRQYNIDPPIVVANIQTVRKYGTELASEFGLLIVDEAHHCVAATFDYLVMQSKAKYKVGLTGTLWRKDGLHVCFTNYFGTKIFKPAERNTVKPEIHRYKIPVEVPGTAQQPWALRINELYENTEYRNKIKRLANAYAMLGHKVLVVTDRTELLEWLNEDNQVTSFLITGKIDDTEERLRIQRQVAEHPEGCILYATQSIFAEGISLNELSCVILGAPTNNKSLVEQIAGRIQRIVKGKNDPVVVDLQLAGATGTRHARTRYNVYIMRNWEVVMMNEPYLAQQLQNLQKFNSQ